MAIVYIATLAASHYALARRALEAGKHVVTVPPAGSSAEWAALTALASQRGLYLMESFPAMFNQAVRGFAAHMAGMHVERIEATWCQRKLDVVRASRIVGWVEPGPARVPKYRQGMAPAGPLHDIGGTVLLPARLAGPVDVQGELSVRGSERATLLRVGAHSARVVLNARVRHHACTVTSVDGEEAALRHELGVYRGYETLELAERELCVQRGRRWAVRGNGLGLEADAVARDLRGAWWLTRLTPDGRGESARVGHAYTAETIAIFEGVAAGGGYALPPGRQVGKAGVHGGVPWHADWIEMDE